MRLRKGSLLSWKRGSRNSRIDTLEQSASEPGKHPGSEAEPAQRGHKIIVDLWSQGLGLLIFTLNPQGEFASLIARLQADYFFVMLIGYAIETLRAEAPLHAASTPGVEAVLAAGRKSRDSGGTATMWVNPTRSRHVPRDSDCGEGL
jgi:hypothetical protein